VITVDIDALSSSGEGIARHEGIVHFVPRALPRERCEVEVVRTSKHWRRAHVQQLLTVSPDRVEPACPIYHVCGGCQLQHMAYARQLEFKRDAVRETLRRVGHIELEPDPTVPCEPFGYRRKVSFTVRDHDGSLALCLHRWDEPSALVRVERCPLLVDELNAVLPAVEAWISSGEMAWCRPDLQRVVLRVLEEGPAVVLACDPLPTRPRFAEKIPLPPGIAAAFCSKKPERTATYQLGPSSSGPVSAGAFTQTNAAVARSLYRTVVGLVDEQCRTVTDAYAGAGELTELLGHRAERVTAIESNKEAVVLARRRIQAAGLRRRVIVRRGHVEELLSDHLPADLVVLDPPRAGCSRRVLDALVEQPPTRIAYISCHPAALARDARRLLDGRRLPDGAYALDRVIPFDMFPQTHHVEVLALLHAEASQDARSRAGEERPIPRQPEPS